MKSEALEFVPWNRREDLIGRSYDLCPLSWPEFMMHDPAADFFAGLHKHFLHLQFSLVDTALDEVAAFGNCVPLSWGAPLADLPDEGWDWAIERGVRNHENGAKPDYLCGLQVVVPPRHRGKGLSALVVGHMMELGLGMGLEDLIVPVRPTLKCRHPLIPMESYIARRREDGLLFDPWLRTHERLGAEIVKVCPRSMRIQGTVAEWEQWTGIEFAGSGAHIVPGALVPVEVDLEKDLGVYVEPNVWMHHAAAGVSDSQKLR